MDLFLEIINQYMKENNLDYKASIENKIIYKNLVLNNDKGDSKVFKIESINQLPPTNMCHSSISFIKLDPYTQTKDWIHEILNRERYVNKMKIK